MPVEPLLEWDPKELGSYRLMGRLGAGGFGTVYAGVAPDGRQVAVKMLRPELSSDQGLRARLAREGAAMRRVSSERTVDIIEVVTEGPVAFRTVSKDSREHERVGWFVPSCLMWLRRCLQWVGRAEGSACPRS